MSVNDGGPAFPATSLGVSSECDQEKVFRLGELRGMTLRDYFAAAALSDYAHMYQHEIGADDIASQCYSLADALLAERGRMG